MLVDSDYIPHMVVVFLPIDTTVIKLIYIMLPLMSSLPTYEFVQETVGYKRKMSWENTETGNGITVQQGMWRV